MGNTEIIEVIRSQNISWFDRSDFNKITNIQKKKVIRYKNLTWFNKDILKQ